MDYLATIRKYGKTEYLKDQVKYNETVKDGWLPLWTSHAFQNYEKIKNTFAERNADMGALPRHDYVGKPCLILASGPSLNDWDDYIKDWPGYIMCSTSQLMWLEKHGKKPDFCCLLDCDPAMTYLVSEADLKGVKILTHPQIPNEYFNLFDSKNLYFFRMYDPGEPFSGKYLPFGYQTVNFTNGAGIKTHIINSGCVGNTMSAIAHVLGFSYIFYAGLDMGYPDGNYRFNNWHKITKKSLKLMKDKITELDNQVKHNEEYQKHLETLLADEKYKDSWPQIKQDLEMGLKSAVPSVLAARQEIVDKYEKSEKMLKGQGNVMWISDPSAPLPLNRPNLHKGSGDVLCDDLCCFYKYSFIMMFGLDMAFRGISTARGIIREIPYLTPKQVMDGLKDGFQHLMFTDKERYKIAREYLKRRGMLIIRNAKMIKMENIQMVPWWKKILMVLWYWWQWNVFPLYEKKWIENQQKKQRIKNGPK